MRGAIVVFHFSISIDFFFHRALPKKKKQSAGSLRFGNPRASPEAAAGCRSSSSSRRWSSSSSRDEQQLLQRGAVPGLSARDGSPIDLLVVGRPPPPSPGRSGAAAAAADFTLGRRRVPPPFSRKEQEPRQAPHDGRHRYRLATPPLAVSALPPAAQQEQQPGRRRPRSDHPRRVCRLVGDDHGWRHRNVPQRGHVADAGAFWVCFLFVFGTKRSIKDVVPHPSAEREQGRGRGLDERRKKRGARNRIGLR